MTVLAEYIKTAFLVSLVAGTVEKLTPTKWSRYVEFVAALILLLLLFAPLKELASDFFQYAEGSFVGDEEEEIETEENYELLLRVAKEKAEKSVTSLLRDEFGIEELEVALTLTLQSDKTILLSEIRVILPDAYFQEAERIEKYIEDAFHTETVIEIGEAKA